MRKNFVRGKFVAGGLAETRIGGKNYKSRNGADIQTRTVFPQELLKNPGLQIRFDLIKLAAIQALTDSYLKNLGGKMKSVKRILLSFFIGAVLALPVALSATTGPCVTCIDYYTDYRTSELCSLTGADPYAQTCDYSCLPTDLNTPQPQGTYQTYCGFDHPCTTSNPEDCY